MDRFISDSPGWDDNRYVIHLNLKGEDYSMLINFIEIEKKIYSLVLIKKTVVTQYRKRVLSILKIIFCHVTQENQ